MATKNSYPEYQEIPYQKTSVEMPLVVAHAKTLIPKYGLTAVQSGLAIFRNESANGSKGVNNGYCGTQADVGKWSVDWESLSGQPIGTSVKTDNAGDTRRFLCFKPEEGYKISLEIATIKCKERGIVNGLTYYKKWVGKEEPTSAETNDFDTLLKSVKAKFN
jgi:hypothetical protein